jgi:hypothetical protein
MAAKKSPPREEGWLRQEEKTRSHRSGAAGVVAHTERILWPTTPPHEEGFDGHCVFNCGRDQCH